MADDNKHTVKIGFGDCEWPILYQGCDDESDGENLPSAISKLSDDQRENVEKTAAEYLFNWTNRKFCKSEQTIRPKSAPCVPINARLNQVIYRSWCDHCQSPAIRRIPGPIDDIDYVKVDGKKLAKDSYRVDNRNLLVRTDGKSWPAYQWIDRNSDSYGTWEIKYTKGVDVPVGGQIAAGELATEFAKALCHDRSCQLPQRVQSITRQEVSMQMMDQFEDLESGHTGIWIIDSWVASVTKPTNGPVIRSPDAYPEFRKRKI